MVRVYPVQQGALLDGTGIEVGQKIGDYEIMVSWARAAWA
jgi:hypothetical protein